ncbi:MAG: hypothetical protein KA247_05975 [Bacteroidetes bacterium]|nr:hypothetical protein [Bacteroidota bacterium]
MRMQKRSFMILLALMMSTVVLAQTETPQPKPAEVPQKTTTETKKAPSPVLKDLDADGVADAQVQSRNGSRQSGRARDTFIDANGDGICDTREQGLGFRRGNGAAAPQSGKRQQGRQK